jgi:hypothetical protein
VGILLGSKFQPKVLPNDTHVILLIVSFKVDLIVRIAADDFAVGLDALALDIRHIR